MKKSTFLYTLAITAILSLNAITQCMTTSINYKVKCKDAKEFTITECKDNLEQEKTVFYNAFRNAYPDSELEEAFKCEETDFGKKKENTLFINAKTRRAK